MDLLNLCEEKLGSMYVFLEVNMLLWDENKMGNRKKNPRWKFRRTITWRKKVNFLSVLFNMAIKSYQFLLPIQRNSGREKIGNTMVLSSTSSFRFFFEKKKIIVLCTTKIRKRKQVVANWNGVRLLVCEHLYFYMSLFLFDNLNVKTKQLLSPRHLITYPNMRRPFI